MTTCYINTVLILKCPRNIACSQVVFYFRNKTSGKVAHLTVAYMLHTKKSARFHEEFGKFVGQSLDRVCNGKKCLPTFITDGEEGLKRFIKVLFMNYVRNA